MKLSATTRAVRSRFLLELALDREKLKANVASALRNYRGANDDGIPVRVTQEALRRRLDDRMHAAGTGSVSSRTYQRWEGAETLPDWDSLDAIAEELGTTVPDILGYDEVTAEDLPRRGASDLGRLAERLEELHRLCRMYPSGCPRTIPRRG